MSFQIIGEVTEIQTVAVGVGIREIARLRKIYGLGRWRKLKGIAWIQLRDGTCRKAELHWYEAYGIDRKGFKIKQILD